MNYYERFAVHYLSIKSPGLLKCDYDTVVGELMTSMMRAETAFDTTLSQRNTYMSVVCKNSLLNFLRRERRFYSKHIICSDMNLFPSRENSPAVRLQKQELKEKVANSALPKRTKEIVALYIENPQAWNSELSRQVGVSRQAISHHINSARQYLSRQNIQLD